MKCHGLIREWKLPERNTKPETENANNFLMNAFIKWAAQEDKKKNSLPCTRAFRLYTDNRTGKATENSMNYALQKEINVRS